MSDEIYVLLRDAVQLKNVDEDGRICVRCMGCGDFSPPVFRYFGNDTHVRIGGNVNEWLDLHTDHVCIPADYPTFPHFEFVIRDSGDAKS